MQEFENRPWPVEQLYRGKFWSSGVRFTSVGSGSEKKLYLANPSDSGVYYFILGPTVRSSGSAKVDKWFNVTVDTTGSAPTDDPINKRSSTSTTTDADVQIGGDNETGVFSGGDHFSPKQAGGGANPSSLAPGTVSDGIANIVDPGDNIVIGVTNVSGSSGVSTSIDIDWIELAVDTT